jgi:hypothetical protein
MLSLSSSPFDPTETLSACSETNAAYLWSRPGDADSFLSASFGRKWSASETVTAPRRVLTRAA